jgi:hypothetical protein
VSSCSPLHASESTPVARLSVLTWIGTAAASLFGNHGASTAPAHPAACSRPTVYAPAAKVQAAVADAQLPGRSRDHLLHEVQRLRDENRQLWDALENTFDGPDTKRRQFAVTASALGLRVQPTLVVLAVRLPPSLLPSRATLGRCVPREAKRARGVRHVLDAACRPLVLALGLDELFLHRKPVLLGSAPYRRTWVWGVQAAERSGPTWAKALAAWPQVHAVAAAGGSGLELGIHWACNARQEHAAQAPVTPVAVHARWDGFPIRQAGARALRAEGQHAARWWQAAEPLARDKHRVARRGAAVRSFRFRLGKAWHKAEQAWAAADRKEQAWPRAVAARAVVRPHGQRNARAWAAAPSAAATAALPGTHGGQARRMLAEARALTLWERLHADVTQAEPDAQRREAWGALGRCPQHERTRGAKTSEPSTPVWRGCVQAMLRHRLGPCWKEG